MNVHLKICESVLKLLKQPPVYCAVINRYAEPEASSHLRHLGYPELKGLPFVCYSSQPPAETSPQVPLPPSPQNSSKLLYYYAMDIASLYPVLALGVCPSDTVLDMCAAPGGKAFSMLQVLRWEEGGALALNDSSPSRVKRLWQVVQQCVSRGVKHSVRITRQNGEKLGEMEESEYDRVLVDAPCSSDRHNAEKWTAKNKFRPDSTTFGKLQESLVLSALHAVKTGGVVVYSTCTMSTTENDGVVDGVLESASKLGYKVDLVAPECEGGMFGKVKTTLFGKLITPSHNLNIGPMYLSKLHLTKK